MFLQWIENSGGKYANAIMKEIELHKVKFSFALRMLPLPIGLQNCMLSVRFLFTHSFFNC